jgi:hypothetical protein
MPEEIDELLANLSRAVEAIEAAKSRTQAALRLAGDLRVNVASRPAAASARTHLKNLNATQHELRFLIAMQSTVSAPTAVEAWESRATAYLRHTQSLATSTDDVVGVLTARL